MGPAGETYWLGIGDLIWAEIVQDSILFTLSINGKRINDYASLEIAMDEAEEIIVEELKTFERIRFLKRKKIELSIGNIEDEIADIIVFPNNPDLTCFAGASLSILTKAENGLYEALQEAAKSTQNGCLDPGQICIIKPHGLKCQALVNAIGPYWEGGKDNEEACLASCYHTALSFAGIEVKTISFASISTGANKYPLVQAAKIAIKTCQSYLATNPETKLERIRFVLKDDEKFSAFRKALDHPN